jgi:iron complex outermembrane receptor protein
MLLKEDFFRFAVSVFLAGAAITAFAQTEHPQTWAQDIAFLEKLPPSEVAARQSAILQIRAQVKLWIEAHPGSNIDLSELPQLPLGVDQATAQIAQLHKAVAAIVQRDPSHPFHLGVTEVEVSAALSPLSPTAESITQDEIQQHDATNVAKAIDLLPGVEIQHLANNRNETSFMIRGFSSNGQVPFYMDGIPIYVPYDGYIDLSRFVTSDIGEIQVARGFSSPLLGPNALGGTVNLVTREPSKKFEGDAAMGTSSGNGLLSSLRLGSKQTRFLAQGTLDWLQADYIPLSGNFQYPAGGYAYLTPGNSLNTAGNVPYALTDQENGSNTRDEKWSGRLGWLPHAGGEYVFSYINQKGQKGVPLYQGANSNAKFKNFWQWPYWNKDSYYFLSDTGVGERSSIKFRVFYDQFRNSINMYDNSKYDSMTSYSPSGSGSEISKYDDHTDGASTEFSSRLVKHNVVGASFFFKDDTHKSIGIYPGAAAYFTAHPTVGTAAEQYLAEYNPVQELRDQQLSTGVEDSITFNARLHATVGFSADHLDGLKADYLNSEVTSNSGKTVVTIANTELLPYECASAPANTSFSGCTAHFWNVNPQASLTYTASASDIVFVTYEDRGRFPTLKQRYSAGMGSALPNPSLATEHSQNWNFGYTRIFSTKLAFDGILFRSDLRNAIESALVPDPDYNSATDPTDANGLCPNNSSVGHCSENINIGKETHEGVEIALRSNPLSWVKLDANYTYLNRDIGNATLPAGTTLSSALVLPSGLPKNKTVGTAIFRLPYQVLGIVSARYESGVTLQDTSYASTSPLYLAHGESLATEDLGVVIPIRAKFNAQAGVRNLLDRNYYYTAGYPEEGRNWFVNLRCHF